MFLSPRVISAGILGLSCLVTAAACYYKSRPTEVNEVMIFCKLQLNVFNYFDKLMSFVEGAKKSVHICMPGIHNPAIQNRLVQLLRKKTAIKIRILINQSGYNTWSDTFLDELKNAGAEIQWTSTNQNKMKHKFCLVDDSVLMTGTLDWGNDLTCDNWNYVLITSKSQLVQPVRNEFYNLWGSSEKSLI